MAMESRACARMRTGPRNSCCGIHTRRSEELLVTADHAQWGEYKRQGPLVRFETGRGAIRAPVSPGSTA